MDKLNFQYLPLGRIDIGLSNVRKVNLQEGIDDLASSIKEIGVQQPVVVIKRDDRYELIIGQRRYLACKKLGLTEIPALITTVRSDTEAIVKSFSENIHRLDLDYRDKMQVAHELKTKLGSVDEAAKHLGVSSQTVKNYLGYAAVPEAIKQMVDAGELSAATAVRIAKSIPDEAKAIRIAQKIKETPRSEGRRNIIDIARENPGKDIESIVKAAKERSMMRKITIHVTTKVYEAIHLASKRYETDREDVVKEAVVEWLQSKGFMK
jgi:ParB family chromosome partitioning protein